MGGYPGRRHREREQSRAETAEVRRGDAGVKAIGEGDAGAPVVRCCGSVAGDTVAGDTVHEVRVMWSGEPWVRALRCVQVDRSVLVRRSGLIGGHIIDSNDANKYAKYEPNLLATAAPLLLLQLIEGKPACEYIVATYWPDGGSAIMCSLQPLHGEQGWT